MKIEPKTDRADKATALFRRQVLLRLDDITAYQERTAAATERIVELLVAQRATVCAPEPDQISESSTEFVAPGRRCGSSMMIANGDPIPENAILVHDDQGDIWDRRQDRQWRLRGGSNWRTDQYLSEKYGPLTIPEDGWKK